MTKERKLHWGEIRTLVVPETATCAWGARAIFRPSNTLEFLHDRLDSWGDDSMLLRKWIADKGITMLKSLLKELGVRGSDESIVSFEDSGFHLAASPCGSCGYLYIIAYKDGE